MLATLAGVWRSIGLGTGSGSVTHRHVSPQFVSLLSKLSNFSENTPTFPLPLPETSGVEEARGRGGGGGRRRVLGRLPRGNSDPSWPAPVRAPYSNTKTSRSHDLHFRSRASKWVLEHVFGYLNLECHFRVLLPYLTLQHDGFKIYVFFNDFLTCEGENGTLPTETTHWSGIEHAPHTFGCLPGTLSWELGSLYNNALQTDLQTPLKGNKGWRDGGHRDMHIII